MGQFNRNMDENLFTDQKELERLEDQLNDLYSMHLEIHQQILHKLYQSMLPLGDQFFIVDEQKPKEKSKVRRSF